MTQDGSERQGTFRREDQTEKKEKIPYTNNDTSLVPSTTPDVEPACALVIVDVRVPESHVLDRDEEKKKSARKKAPPRNDGRGRAEGRCHPTGSCLRFFER